MLQPEPVTSNICFEKNQLVAYPPEVETSEPYSLIPHHADDGGAGWFWDNKGLHDLTASLPKIHNVALPILWKDFVPE